jgi:hypothetical protein
VTSGEGLRAGIARPPSPGPALRVHPLPQRGEGWSSKSEPGVLRAGTRRSGLGVRGSGFGVRDSGLGGGN